MEQPRITLDIEDLARWKDAMPSPLAIPLEVLYVELSKADKDWLKLFLAGTSAFISTLKFMAFILISDIFKHADSGSIFLNEDLRKQIYPRIHRILSSNPQFGHWVDCVRTIIRTYNNHADDFFAPELLRGQGRTKTDPLQLEDKLNKLVNIRNQYTHGGGPDLRPQLAKEYFKSLEEPLARLCGRLEFLCDYNLVQLSSSIEPSGRKGWFNAQQVYLLKGCQMNPSNILKGPVELCFGFYPWRRRRLYLFDSQFQRPLELHPFILFSQDTDLEGVIKEASFFFYNEIRDKNLTYELVPTCSRPINVLDKSIGLDETFAKPLMDEFTVLKFLASGSEHKRRQALSLRSRFYPLSFEPLINFHREGFTGRHNYFDNVESFISNRNKCLWLKGQAGFGKTAFMSQLAYRHRNAIHYFISPERLTANADTFLNHVCQAIIDRMRFPDELTKEVGGDTERLHEFFKSLLRRAGAALEGKEPLVILIDGLDESERYANMSDAVITGFLPQSQEEIPDNITFVISSRPEEVDLSKLADVTLDLAPFTRREVEAILRRRGWDAGAAALGYDKSLGQPLYFRFLLEGIRSGKFRSEHAEHLPDGVTGFYKRFWNECTEARKGRKNQEKARMAGMMQDALGLIATSRDPLSKADLRDLLVDYEPEYGELIDILKKENLGSYVVGSANYSIFHDTLREYVLAVSRPEGDTAPYGDGLPYHRMLAAWRRSQSRQIDRSTLYHLLHSRQYGAVVACFEGEKGRRLYADRLAEDGGGASLMRELDYAVQAARQLGDFPRAFLFSLLIVGLKRVSNAAAIPDAIGILAGLDRSEELEQLLAEAGRKKWEYLCKCWAAYAKWGNRPRAKEYEQLLLNELHADFLNEARQLLPFITPDLVPEAAPLLGKLMKAKSSSDFLSLCPGTKTVDIEVAEGLLRENPDLFGLNAPGSKSSSLLLGTMLVLNGNEAGYAILAGIEEWWDAEFAKELLGIAMIAGPEKLLGTLAPLRTEMKTHTLTSLALILFMAAGRHDLIKQGSLFEAWVARGSDSLRLLYGCYRASLPGASPEDREAAEALFEQQAGGMPLACSFACLLFLHTARLHADVCDNGRTRWCAVLHSLVECMCGLSKAFEYGKKMDEVVMPLIMDVWPILRQVGHHFKDKGSAFLFALAAASPALEGMASEPLREWMRRRLESRENLDGVERDPVYNSIRDIVIREEITNLDEIKKLTVPVLACMLEDPKVPRLVAAMEPMGLASWCAKDFFNNCLGPTPLAGMRRLLPYLTDENDRLMEVDPLPANIFMKEISSPMEGYAMWRDSVPYDFSAISAEAAMLREKREGRTGDDLFEEEQALILDSINAAKEDGEGARFPARWLDILLFCEGRFEDALDVAVRMRVNSYGAVTCLDLLRLRQPQALSLHFDKVLEAGDTDISKDQVKRAMAAAIAARSDEDLELLAQRCEQEGIGEDIVGLLLDEAVRRELHDAVAVLLAHASYSERNMCCWIEGVMRRDRDRGRRMWDAYAEHQGMKELEFLTEIKEDFDETLAKSVRSGTLKAESIRSVSDSLGEGFVAMRRAMFPELLKSEENWDELAAFVASMSLDDLGFLVADLGNAAPPPWFADQLYDRLDAVLDEPEAAPKQVVDVSMLAFTKVLAEERQNLLAEKALKAFDAMGELADKGALAALYFLATRLGKKDLLPELADQDLFNEFSSIAEILIRSARITPKRTWSLLREPPFKGAAAGRRAIPHILTSALPTDLAWVEAHVADMALRCGANDLLERLRDAFGETDATAWKTRCDVDRLATTIVESDNLDLECAWGMQANAKFLAEHAPEGFRRLVIKALPKLTIVGILFQCFGADILPPTPEEEQATSFLFAAPLAAVSDELCAAVEEQYRRYGTKLRDRLKELIVFCRHLPAAGQQALYDRLEQTLAAIVEQSLGLEWDDDVFNSFAASFPARALTIIMGKGHVKKGLEAPLVRIANADPGLLSQILAGPYKRLDQDDRNTFLAAVQRNLGLEHWRQVAAGTKLQLSDLMEGAASYAMDAARFDFLLGAGEGAPAKKFEFHCAVYAGCVVSGSDDHAMRNRLRDAIDIGFASGTLSCDDNHSGLLTFTLHDPSGAEDSAVSKQGLSLLFGIMPDRMEQALLTLEREIPGHRLQSFYSEANELRKAAFPSLVKCSPRWLQPRLKEWRRNEMMPGLFSDDFSALLKGVEPVLALEFFVVMVNCLFSDLPKDDILQILDRETDPAKLRDCLMTLLVEYVPVAPNKLGELTAICLEYASRAGMNPADLLVSLASMFKVGMDISGIKPPDFNALLKTLRALSRGEACSEEGEEAQTIETVAPDPRAVLSMEDAARLDAFRKLLEKEMRTNPDSSTIPILQGSIQAIMKEAREKALN